MRTIQAIAVLSLVLVLALLAGCGAGGQAGTTPAPTTAAVPTAAAPTTAATEAPTDAATPTVEASPSPEATETVAATDEPTAQATSAGGAAGSDVPENALVSVPAEEAPELDGAPDDAAWNDAPEVEVTTSGGANESDTTVTMKSVHTDEMVYFLFTWADPTESFVRVPWEKQVDGTWTRITDPNDKGEDNNVTYEDKISLIWNINDSIPGFEQAGCFTTCHAGENPDQKPYGNKYTAAEGQLGDIWHWKAVRNLMQVDDQYLDHTRFSPETRSAGRKSDKADGGGYVNNETEDKTMPAFMAPGGGDKTGAPGYILDDEKVEFDDSLFKAGDRLPSIVKSAFEGDRGDLSAGWQYDDGTWTLEIGRELETGSETDVQFDDLAKTYYFGVATFDNAQVRHAFQSGVTPFVFQREQ